MFIPHQVEPNLLWVSPDIVSLAAYFIIAVGAAL
jgi:hypothetical protein